MKFGDITQGIITRFDAKGRGEFDVALPDGRTKPMTVPFTTIGDEVEAEHIKKEKGRYIGKLSRIITPGPDRIPLPDPAFENFSGAMWLHIAYEAQLKFKRDMINAAFAEANHDARVESVMSSSKTTFYRNRMDYVFGSDGEIGLKAYGAWNRYIDVKKDILLSEDVPEILDVFRELLRRFPSVVIWDARRHEGDLRYVVIREGKNTGERLIALVIQNLEHITPDMRKFLLLQLDPFANNIVLSENPGITDLSYGETIVPLKGNATFEEEINGTTYTIHLNSFFQTNSDMAAKLQDTVYEFCGDLKNKTLLDLYCGLGFFAINFAQRESSLKARGFEIDARSIVLANQNAGRNNVQDRCEFKAGKSEDLSWKDIPSDVTIIDPPRAGLHPRVIEALIAKPAPTLVYVSCNFHRMVEELKELKKVYTIEKITALDLFPHTPHVEVIVKLTLR